jgi:hypothetical protein
MSQSGRDTTGKRRRTVPGMSVKEAYMLLGLRPGADWELVHATYRRLALKYHPDHNRDGNSLDHFKQRTAAYRVLRKKHRLDQAESDRERAECERCGDYCVLHTALDGMRCCVACLSLASRRPLLPAPPITIVSCATTIVLLALALGCLVAEAFLGGGSYSVAAFGLGVLSLFSLAVTCLTVVYTADPRRSPRRRTVQAIRPARSEFPVPMSGSVESF